MTKDTMSEPKAPPVLRSRSINVKLSLSASKKSISSRALMKKSSSKRRLGEINISNSSSNNASIVSQSNNGPSSPRTHRDTKRSAVSKRRVSFDANNTIAMESKLTLVDDDIALLWWSQDELDEIMEREQNVFEVFSTCCTSYVDSVLRVWDSCSTAADEMGHSSHRRHSHHNKSKKLGASPSLSVFKNNDIEKIANAPARGMETDVVISFMPECRSKAIQAVIVTQRAMAKASFNSRSSTMRRRYRSLSKAASIFAKTIAAGDAQVAASLYQ